MSICFVGGFVFLKNRSQQYYQPSPILYKSFPKFDDFQLY